VEEGAGFSPLFTWARAVESTIPASNNAAKAVFDDIRGRPLSQQSDSRLPYFFAPTAPRHLPYNSSK
jgi:hypothetical protein